MSNQKSKNVSKKIPNGTRVQTRDEHFQETKADRERRKRTGEKRYTKPDHKGKTDNYRITATIDTNRKEEMALIKLTTSEKGKPLPNNKQGIRFSPHVFTKDSKGNPIKKTPKKDLKNKALKGEPVFDVRKTKKLDKHTVNEIKKECVKDPRNRKLLRELKGRK